MRGREPKVVQLGEETQGQEGTGSIFERRSQGDAAIPGRRWRLDGSVRALVCAAFVAGCSGDLGDEPTGDHQGLPEPQTMDGQDEGGDSTNSLATGGQSTATGGANGGSSMGNTGGATGGSSTGGAATGGDVGTGGSDSEDGGPDPIGDGWEEYFPDFDYHVPPNADEYGERYTYEDGVFHLWVKDTDMSTFPGQDSGPRSEVRVRNEYASGGRQFQADFMVVEGAEKVGIWQLFQRPYPWMIRVYDGEYRQFGNGSSFGDVPFGTWQRIHTVHDSESRNLEIYLDGQLVLDTTISESDGSVDWYNKFGVYGREGMGELNEIYFKNVHYFRKD